MAADARDPLSESTITRLLGLGLAEVNETVQSLAMRIAAADGGRWITEAQERCALSPLDEPAWEACSVGELRERKDRGKARYARGADLAERLPGLWCYLAAVATARVSHGVVIATRPASELARTLLALAEVLPGAWGRVFAEAGLSFEETDGV